MTTMDAPMIQQTPQMKEFAAQIEAKQKERDALQEKIDENQRLMDEMQAEIFSLRNETQRKIDALQEKRKQLNTEIFDTRRMIRDLEAEIKALQQKLRLAMDAMLASDKFRVKKLEFDKLTADMPWRAVAFDYQLDGAMLMGVNGRTINADKMGLGKSIQSLMACDMVQAQRVLVICPSPLVGNFIREVKKWAPHRVPIAMNNMSKIERYSVIQMMKAIGGPVCVVINYEAWRRDNALVDGLIEMQFDTVICDEFNKVKNPETNAARGVDRIVLQNNICPSCSAPAIEVSKGNFFDGACTQCDWETTTNDVNRHRDHSRRSVKYCFPLSGTPVLNRPDELYFALHLILPEIFYSMYIFRNMYCYQDNEGKWRWLPHGLRDLETHLQGHYVARTKKDVGIKLPPQELVVAELEFDREKYPNQWRIMQQIDQHAQIVLENGDSTAMMEVIAIITRKRQANVCPAGIKIFETIKDDDGKVIEKRLILDVGDEVTESIKLDYAFDLLTEVTADGNKADGERAIVFSQFKAPLFELAKRLNDSGISAVVMVGDTSDYERQRIAMDFDRSVHHPNGYRHQVLLTNFAVGGVGHNFTAATQVVVLDEPWNPGSLEQALDRVNRIGQTKDSTVTIIRIKDSIDDWMADLLAKKGDVVNAFETRGREMTQFLQIAMHNGEML